MLAILYYYYLIQNSEIAELVFSLALNKKAAVFSKQYICSVYINTVDQMSS